MPRESKHSSGDLRVALARNAIYMTICNADDDNLLCMCAYLDITAIRFRQLGTYITTHERPLIVAGDA